MQGARRKILVSMSKLKDLEGHLTAVEADIAQPDKFVSCVEDMRQVRGVRDLHGPAAAYFCTHKIKWHWFGGVMWGWLRYSILL